MTTAVAAKSMAAETKEWQFWQKQCFKGLVMPHTLKYSTCLGKGFLIVGCKTKEKKLGKIK